MRFSEETMNPKYCFLTVSFLIQQLTSKTNQLDWSVYVSSNPWTLSLSSFFQTVKLVDACQWSDSLVELQMWSRLSVLAFNAENHSLVLQCGQRAVAFAESEKCLVKRTPKKPDRWLMLWDWTCDNLRLLLAVTCVSLWGLAVPCRCVHFDRAQICP